MVVLCVSAITSSNIACSSDSTDDHKDLENDNSIPEHNSGGIDTSIPAEAGSTASAGNGGTQTEIAVTEVAECSGTYDFGMLGPLFTSYGRCIEPTDKCIGGTPDQIDVQAILLANIQGFESEEMTVDFFDLPVTINDCEEGFVCCINTDECESVYNQIKSHPVFSSWTSGLLITCTSSDLCNSYNGTPLQVGCPEGEICCVGTEPGYTF